MPATLPSLSITPFPPPAQDWVNRYAHWAQAWRPRLAAPGAQIAAAVQALGLNAPRWVAWNDALAGALGWPPEWREAAQASALEVLSGNALWPGMTPVATVYSGHQFGVWAGQLGDGRALLLGEIQAPGGAQELQLKGAGPTPYSRRADGRAVLRSSIREFLCSEAMHGLGIPTTRALSLTACEQPVRREVMESAAVVARVAPSFIRFGHFEHFAHSGVPGHHEVLEALVDFVVEHHAPELRDAPSRPLALLQWVVERTADLMVQWQAVGFCHGVMNTDNMSILGLTIDYGPFGFLDAFDPAHICNHSDHQGRYSWQRQPQVAYWNLHALAQALLPLVPGAAQDTQVFGAVLQRYELRFVDGMLQRWCDKLGLLSRDPQDGSLVNDWLSLMASQRVDFTIAWRRLCGFQMGQTPDSPTHAPLRDLFLDRAAFDAWAERYSQRLVLEGSEDAERAVRMRSINPLYVLRNHMAEAAIRQAQVGDDSEVRRLHTLLQRPFDEQPGCEADADFPPDWASSIEVSCSS